MILSLAVAALVAITPVESRSGIREEPALRKSVEDQGRRLVEAINSDDVALRGRTVKELFAPSALENGGDQKLLQLLARLAGDMGTLEFHHAEAIPGDQRVSLHVYVRSPKVGTWRDLQFWLEPAPPHRLQSLVFIADVTEPVYLPNGDVTSPATLDWLNDYVAKLANEDDLSGAILIASGDKVVFQRYFGHADLGQRRPIGPETRFNLASGGKMFTALAVAQLVREGRLRYEDTVVRHLPELAQHDFARTVTVAHLLTHTSGIAEFWDEEYEKQWKTIRTLKQFLPHVLRAGTRFKPGEQFEYSNSNYILAGLVVEAVAGTPYDQVIARRIFAPLGMRDTGLFPFDDRDSLQATPLKGRRRAWSVADRGYRGSSAGGCLSTAADMLRFGRGLVGGRVVPDSILSMMTTSKTEGLPGQQRIPYGYGFEIKTTSDGARSFGHGGIAEGVNFEFRYFPQSDITLVVFSNQDNGAYDDLRRNTTKLITGER